jgi:hypothetical protein
MIDDLLIINETGQLLFSWHPEGHPKENQDDLISGFFSALNTFATFERGEDLKFLKLGESNIIFEKYEELYQKLIFIITTKNEKVIDLLHSFVHDIMDSFVEMFRKDLDKKFDGAVHGFKIFTDTVKKILINLGIDQLPKRVEEIDDKDIIKAIAIIEPLEGNVLFIHAKQYINKDDISYLIPLLINSGKRLYQNKELNSILITSLNNENLLVELRERVVIVKFYDIINKFNAEYEAIEFIKNKKNIMKKQKKLKLLLENIQWGPNIRNMLITDLLGTILASKLIGNTDINLDNFTEISSFLSSSRKACEQIYNKDLFISYIEGQNSSLLCINLDICGLFFTLDTGYSSNFQDIQKLGFELLKKI